MKSIGFLLQIYPNNIYVYTYMPLRICVNLLTPKSVLLTYFGVAMHLIHEMVHRFSTMPILRSPDSEFRVPVSAFVVYQSQWH